MCAQAERLEVLAAGRAAVRVGVDDQLGAAAQRRLRGGVHVADDHVRLEAFLEQRVGAAVDADEHGLEVADVGPQRLDVALVVDAAHDDQRRPVAEVGVEARQLDACRRAGRAPRACTGRCSARTPRSARAAFQYLMWATDSEAELDRIRQRLLAYDPATYTHVENGVTFVEGCGPDHRRVIVAYPGPNLLRRENSNVSALLETERLAPN